MYEVSEAEMMYLKYLRSLLRHKWYVFLAGRKTGVSLWRLLIHDWQKFLPAEFIPYAQKFHGEFQPVDEVPIGLRYAVVNRFQEDVDRDFDYAWLHHQKYGPHHWQFWVLIQDSDKPKALPMPEAYVREMVADWMGASMAYTGSWDMRSWLISHLPKISVWVSGVTGQRLGVVLSEQGYENLWTEMVWENSLLWFHRDSPGR